MGLSGLKDWATVKDKALFAGMHNGKLFEDYYLNRPTLGKIKLNDFAKEFALIFSQK